MEASAWWKRQPIMATTTPSPMTSLQLLKAAHREAPRVQSTPSLLVSSEQGHQEGTSGPAKIVRPTHGDYAASDAK